VPHRNPQLSYEDVVDDVFEDNASVVAEIGGGVIIALRFLYINQDCFQP
jgi:hypothetical protein